MSTSVRRICWSGSTKPPVEKVAPTASVGQFVSHGNEPTCPQSMTTQPRQASWYAHVAPLLRPQLTCSSSIHSHNSTFDHGKALQHLRRRVAWAPVDLTTYPLLDLLLPWWVDYKYIWFRLVGAVHQQNDTNSSIMLKIEITPRPEGK